MDLLASTLAETQHDFRVGRQRGEVCFYRKTKETEKEKRNFFLPWPGEVCSCSVEPPNKTTRDGVADELWGPSSFTILAESEL